MILTIYIKSKEIYEKLKKEAEKNDRTVSYIISQAIEKYLKGLK